MTKCIVLGEKPNDNNGEPIKFIYHFTRNIVVTTHTQPKSWDNIELICKAYEGSVLSLMFAYNDNRHDGKMYLGCWNDGYVE
jgi:hypothetical protein